MWYPVLSVPLGPLVWPANESKADAAIIVETVPKYALNFITTSRLKVESRNEKPRRPMFGEHS